MVYLNIDLFLSDKEFTTDLIKYQTTENFYKFELLISGNTYYWKAVPAESIASIRNILIENI